VTSPAASEVHSTQQATSCTEFKARFEQQPTTFAASSARFEQQWTSNRINDERISQCLRLRQLTKAEIYTLIPRPVRHHRLHRGQRFIVIKQSSGTP
jgi:uncharacterized damage-inducible protein DinB